MPPDQSAGPRPGGKLFCRVICNNSCFVISFVIHKFTTQIGEALVSRVHKWTSAGCTELSKLSVCEVSILSRVENIKQLQAGSMAWRRWFLIGNFWWQMQILQVFCLLFLTLPAARRYFISSLFLNSYILSYSIIYRVQCPRGSTSARALGSLSKYWRLTVLSLWNIFQQNHLRLHHTSAV